MLAGGQIQTFSTVPKSGKESHDSNAISTFVQHLHIFPGEDVTLLHRTRGEIFSGHGSTALPRFAFFTHYPGDVRTELEVSKAKMSKVEIGINHWKFNSSTIVKLLTEHFFQSLAGGGSCCDLVWILWHCESLCKISWICQQQCSSTMRSWIGKLVVIRHVSTLRWR